jgi:error-prone DNA polymerase
MPELQYAELSCQSAFSFREGASLPEELVERARELGLAALGICDRDGVYGLVRAWKASHGGRMRVLYGALLTLEGLPECALYAEDLRGWRRLCALLTRARGASPRGSPSLALPALLEDPGGLTALIGGAWRAHPEASGALRDAFGGGLYVRAARLLRRSDARALADAEALARWLGCPVVATGRVLLHDPSRQPAQDVLTCLRHGVPLSEAGLLLEPNAERRLRSPREMALLFRDRPAWLRRTLEVAERCRFDISQLAYAYPSEVAAGRDPDVRLRELVAAGARRRWPEGAPREVGAQLRRELTLIAELRYAPYFLTVEDIVRFARERGILCQGRGSAANSAVCYALGITAVDPARSSTLFERFLSKERGEPPDIDVDFEHERREEVIQYIYDRYGRDRAAMVNAVICWRTRSAVRAAGKALEIEPPLVDRLARALSTDAHERPVEERLAAAGTGSADGRVRRLVAVVDQLRGLPQHVSIHVGGFVIAEQALDTLCPVEPAAMAGRTVIQWDKDDVDAVGFVKVDVLGLGILTAIRKAMDLVAAHGGPRLSLAEIPREDPAVYDQLCAADTVGVFQVESRAQMAMLPRLKPRNFYDLVVEISLVRPGPLQGGMVRPYLARRAGREPVRYAHPALEPILARTLGVPIFQEQVMAMAMAVAGYTGGEADDLRRAMGHDRKKGGLTAHTDALVERMVERGLDRGYAGRIAQQIRGFGEYGFPESHAASFACLVYASAYLRRYWPAAWAAALINSQPMGFYPPRVIVDDARRHGVSTRPICVQSSRWGCTLEPSPGGPVLRLGLRLIRGLGPEAGRRLTAAREAGPFADLADLARRTGLDRGALRALARADALRALAPRRREALWAIEAIWTRSTPLLEGLPGDTAEVSLPELDPEEVLRMDYRSTGISLTEHPVALRRGALDATPIEALSEHPAGAAVRVAGLVVCRQRPRTARGVLFLTLEDETGMVGVIVKPEVYREARGTWRDGALLVVSGRLQRSGGALSLLGESVEPFLDPPVHTRSRDFR